MINRVFHSFDKWEDYRHNFYGGVSSYPTQNTVQLCADLLKDSNKFEAALYNIITKWPNSCEHNLTNVGMNRIAYLGQAACALVLGVPASVSMGAYNTLTQEEQLIANKLAQTYLDLWLGTRSNNVNT